MEELQIIENKIYDIRGQKVMLDFDLATLYQVETKRLKEAVRRNIERFEGEEFMFELTETEYNLLKDNIRTQIETFEIDDRGRYPKYAPFAFTEQGVAMLSSVLRSKTAIMINRSIMRAFVSMRKRIIEQLNAFDRRIQQLETLQNRNSAEDHQIPDKLSKEATLKMYSRRAIVIFTRNKMDHVLLKFLGARFNP